MSRPSHHIELAVFTDDTAILRSRKPTLLVSYLEPYLTDLQWWLSEWRIAINVSKSTAIIFARAGRHFIQRWSVTLLGILSNGSKKTRYLRVTFDTWHLVASHRSGYEEGCSHVGSCLLLNRKTDISVRNGVFLYKQLIRPIMYYARLSQRSAARTRVRRLQVSQSKCPRLANGALWYVSKKEIHKDLSVPLFADHVRALIASFEILLADVGNPTLLQLGRYLCWPRVDPVAWRDRKGRQWSAGQSRPSPAMAKSTKRFAFSSDQPSAFRLRDRGVSLICQGIRCKVGARPT